MRTRRDKRQYGTGSLFQKGNCWYLQVRDKSGKLVTRSVKDPDTGEHPKTKSHAERLAVLIAADIRTNIVEPERKQFVSLGELNFAYEQAFPGRLNTMSAKNRRGVMERFIREFSSIESITHERLGVWIEKRLQEPKERGGGQRTQTNINRELSFLRRLLNWAVKTGKIEKNPMMGFAFLEESNHRERILSTEERKRLLKALDDPNFSSIRLIVLIALYCGMRRGEILNLSWEDIDERERVFDLLRTKSKRGIKRRRRKIPIPSPIMEEIKIHPHISDWLFPSPVDSSKPIGEIKKSFTSLLKKAKITGFHFHDLRHVAATLMAEAGVHPRIMMEIFGWSSMKMAERYTNPNQEALRQAVNAIAQKIG